MNTPFPNPLPDEMKEAYCTDVTVHRAVHIGASMEQVILELIRQRNEVMEKYMNLHHVTFRVSTEGDEQ